jgi:hypothetical protein
MVHTAAAAFSSQLKSKVGRTLAKAEDLRVNLNLVGTPITSRTHTHPSQSQTSPPTDNHILVFSIVLVLSIYNKQQSKQIKLSCLTKCSYTALTIIIVSLQDHQETDRFFAVSKVQFPSCTSGQFHFHRETFSSQVKS